MEYFNFIDKVKFEGTGSRNALAFRYYDAENPNVWIFRDIQTYIKSKPFADDAGNAINSI